MIQRSIRKFLALSGNRFAAWFFRPRVIAAAMGSFVVFAGIWLWIAFSGPHMDIQPHLRPYKTAFPLLPKGVIPVEADPLWANTKTIPPRFRPEDGRIYYGYYCSFCHGKNGGGEGPVGVSFIPYPADLTAPRIRALSDSSLIHSMMNGTGHEPLLGPVVPPQHRPAIVAFIRTLGRAR